MLLYLYKMQPEPNMFLCKTPALKVNSSNLKLYDFTGCIYVLETLRCNSELKQCRQNVSLTGKIWYVQHEFVNTKLILYNFNVTSTFDKKKNVFNVVKDVNLKKISTSLSIYDPHKTEFKENKKKVESVKIMKGAYKGKVRGTQDKPAGKDLHRVEHVKDNMREEGQHGGDSTTGTGCMGFEAISKQICDFKS